MKFHERVLLLKVENIEVMSSISSLSTRVLGDVEPRAISVLVCLVV